MCINSLTIQAVHTFPLARNRSIRGSFSASLSIQKRFPSPSNHSLEAERSSLVFAHASSLAPSGVLARTGMLEWRDRRERVEIIMYNYYDFLKKKTILLLLKDSGKR
jgi:hypothetical protein